MARPRKVLGEDVEREIAVRTARGESAQTIFWALRTPVGIRTISRRMRELRAAAASGKKCPTCGRPREE